MAAGSKADWIYGTNDPGLADVIREADLNWGPLVGVRIMDRGRVVVVGARDLPSLMRLIEAIEKLHDAGFPRALEAAEAVMSSFPGFNTP